MPRIDDDARREWLRALRRFKHGIKVRAKLGVLETYCQQVASQRKGSVITWDAPNWEHERWVTLLYNCIKNNEYPPELLVGFVKTAEVTFLTPSMQPTVMSVVSAVNYVCTRLSKPLRVKFGVLRCTSVE